MLFNFTVYGSRALLLWVSLYMYPVYTKGGIGTASLCHEISPPCKYTKVKHVDLTARRCYMTTNTLLYILIKISNYPLFHSA